MKAFAVVLVGVALLGAADDAGDAVQKEVAKLQGTWTATSLRWNGKDLETVGKFAIQLEFKDDQATVRSSKDVEKEYAKFRVKIDPSTDPHIVDIIIGAGVQKDAKMEGIYRIKEDELTICAKVFGNDRPTDFESAEGSSTVLIVLKREKQ
jgi:uncharacterized protein (TIGR03067 family)